MQRPAYPGVDGNRHFLLLRLAHAVQPHARPQPSPGVEQRPVVIHLEAGAFILWHGRNRRFLGVATLASGRGLDQIGQRRNVWNVCRSACRSAGTRAVIGRNVWNVWNVAKRMKRCAISLSALSRPQARNIFQRAIEFMCVPFCRPGQYWRGVRLDQRNVCHVCAEKISGRGIEQVIRHDAPLSDGSPPSR